MKKDLVRKKPFKPGIIGIIGGKGMMGRWFTRFFRKHGFTVIASDLGTRITNEQVAKRSDVIVFAVPISHMEAVIASVTPFVRSDQLLLDICSLKEKAVRAMLKSPAHVIGMHPMFGPFSKNMKGKNIILCPARVSSAKHSWLKALLQKHGAVLHASTPGKHDNAMAVVQMLTHLRNFVFAQTLSDLKFDHRQFLMFASPPSRIEFDCMARILNQNLDMYAEIGTHNPQRKSVLNAYERAFKKFNSLARTGDTSKFQRSITTLARTYKNTAPRCQRESDLLIEYLTNNILT